jgi:hypothetical protein
LRFGSRGRLRSASGASSDERSPRNPASGASANGRSFRNGCGADNTGSTIDNLSLAAVEGGSVVDVGARSVIRQVLVGVAIRVV